MSVDVFKQTVSCLRHLFVDLRTSHKGLTESSASGPNRGYVNDFFLSLC